MSKAFTKEDSTDEPVFVAPRAPLPGDVANYVTARGLQLLREEWNALEGARDQVAEATPERAALQTRMQALEERLNSAVLVEPGQQLPQDEVRFGAHVMVQGEDARPVRKLQIVGVDEADAAQGLIAFVAPLSRALLGKRAGDVVTLRTPRGEEELEVLSVSYGSAQTLDSED